MAAVRVQATYARRRRWSYLAWFWCSPLKSSTSSATCAKIIARLSEPCCQLSPVSFCFHAVHTQTPQQRLTQAWQMLYQTVRSWSVFASSFHDGQHKRWDVAVTTDSNRHDIYAVSRDLSFTGTQNKITYFILMLLIVWVCSFSKMSPYVKFAKDKVFVFVVLCEKCENSATVSLTLILTLICRAAW